jgi:hypothetical protein
VESSGSCRQTSVQRTSLRPSRSGRCNQSELAPELLDLPLRLSRASVGRLAPARGVGSAPAARQASEGHQLAEGALCRSAGTTTVVDGGYEHQGRRYRSLSAVARAITGTQWSGPLFFGLRKTGGGK